MEGIETTASAMETLPVRATPDKEYTFMQDL